MKWLEAQGEAEPSDDLLDLATEDLEKETAEMPEPYAILLQLRRFHLSWSSGGYEDQPHIRMNELNAAAAAEAEYKYRQDMNAARKRKHLEALKQRGNS